MQIITLLLGIRMTDVSHGVRFLCFSQQTMIPLQQKKVRLFFDNAHFREIGTASRWDVSCRLVCSSICLSLDTPKTTPARRVKATLTSIRKISEMGYY